MSSLVSLISMITLLTGCFHSNQIFANDPEDEMVFTEGDQSTPKFGTAPEVRYLLYDVNPGEGFNLRRDVYIRMANLVKFLNEDSPWVLVLPPWGQLYHWKSRHIQAQTKIPWSLFFDLASLRLHVPVLEFEDYMKLVREPAVEEVIYLQHFPDDFSEEWGRLEFRDCIKPAPYQQQQDGTWRGKFFGFQEFYAKSFRCLSAESEAVAFKDFLLQNTTANSVFLDRAETLIHGHYSSWSREYWTGRRSQVFAKHLRDIGDAYREENLDSTDEKDNTALEVWTDMQRQHGEAKGGPYLAVHLRRKDYLFAHKKEVPSLSNAAKQLQNILEKHELKKLFIATDAPQEVFNHLKGMFKKIQVFRFKPSEELHQKYKDGGVAIIDQWISAHARVFVGTHVSTFSLRIQEEREILGFDPEMTFNRLCGDEESHDCDQPTKWKIVY